MAKKYYQDRKDRTDESRGMKKHYHEDMKENMNEDRGRKKHYRGDLDEGYMGMLSEDHSAPANLPQNVVHEYYPPADYMDSHYLDDTIRGIDDNNRDNVDRIDRHQSDSMY